MAKFSLKRFFSPKRRAIRRADAARDRGDPAAAAHLYRQVAERWPGGFGILMQLGNALKDSGAHEDADRVYLEALAIQPDDADCYLQRGHLMKLKGDLPRAEAMYREALRCDPSLSAAADELQRIEEAAQVVSRTTSSVAEMPRRGGRSDLSMPASVVYRRIGIELRWRRN